WVLRRFGVMCSLASEGLFKCGDNSVSNTHTQGWFGWLLAAFIAALVALNGCVSSRPQSFAMSFLPPTPLPEPDVRIEEPPRVTPSPYSSEPNLTPRIAPEVEKRLRTAEERFEAGKKAYQAGDLGLARQEFDRALDVLLSAAEGLAGRQRLE